MPGDDVSELLEKLKEKLIVEALSTVRRCCRNPPSKQPVEIESLQELSRLERECKVLLVMFYSPTCPYCRAFTPIFVEASREYGDKIVFARVNVYTLPEAAALYGVMGVPTTIAIVNGRPVLRLVGFVDPDRFEDAIGRALEAAGCPIALQSA